MRFHATTPSRSVGKTHPKATRVSTLHTHYDNLKVARNASPGAIDAAYQAMLGRFGPEHNPGDTLAARKMAIIQASYSVLSNPHQRALHDLWVAQNDDEEPAPPPPQTIPPLWMHSEVPLHYHQTQPSPLPQPPQGRSVLPRMVEEDRSLSHLQRNWSLYALGIVVACLALVTEPAQPYLGHGASSNSSSNSTSPLRGFPVPEFFAPRYTRPATAPNGRPWPASAGPIDGYPLLNDSGGLGLTLDNSQNSADMFIKLVSLGSNPPQPVRHLFVPAQGSLAVEQLTPGRYELRYRNLATGALVRSPPVSVQPAPAQGAEAPARPLPAATVLLRKEGDGSQPALKLSEREFF
jgi:hypothetical protein